MKIEHKRIWEPVVITLENKKEVQVIRSILGMWTDSDTRRLCSADVELLDAFEMASSMVDVLYTRLCESLE